MRLSKQKGSNMTQEEEFKAALRKEALMEVTKEMAQGLIDLAGLMALFANIFDVKPTLVRIENEAESQKDVELFNVAREYNRLFDYLENHTLTNGTAEDLVKKVKEISNTVFFTMEIKDDRVKH